jgi:single-stranded DNA-specific DHH superfamily exonuclease
MISEAVEFLKNLTSDSGLKIFSHIDADGVCSAAILISFLRKRGIVPKDGLPPIQLTDVPPQSIDPSKVMIFTDLSSDTILPFIHENSLIIDHHIFEERPAVPFYNPREADKSAYIPASYLVWEVCSKLEDMEDMKWVAAVGVLGDRGELNSELCREFVGQFENKEELGKTADYIFSVDLVEGTKGDIKMIEELLSAKGPKDIMENPYFRFCYQEVQNELASAIKVIEKDGIFRFIEVNSRYNIKSIIASQILEKEEGVVVAAYSGGDDYKITLRTNTNLNLGAIAKAAAESVGGTGGGHEKAAGAKVAKEKLSAFKEELILLSENG